MPKEYKSSDIKILEGLDAVRMRPGMYIGTTGIKGLHHILWEIVDNAIDEAANGHAKKIEVKLYADGSASVEDDGRGIPIDEHPTAHVSGVEVVFTQLHAGGKFDHSNYNYSGGLHGVGASVTNALSEWLKVEVYNGKTTYGMEFSSYANKRGKVYSGIPKGHLADLKIKTKKRGTFIRFKPDARVFETVEFNDDMIIKRLRELAFLNEGLIIDFIDERIPDAINTKHFQYKGGIKDFVKYLNEGKRALYAEPLYVNAEKDEIKVEIAIQHNDDYSENICSFVNNIPTGEGGEHETGFKTGFTTVLNNFAQNVKKVKEKLVGEDFREGLTVILSIKMKDAQFEGQTKARLGNSKANAAVRKVTVEGLTALLSERKTEKIFSVIVEKALGAAKVRKARSDAGDMIRKQNKLDVKKLVGKLSSCSSRTAELNELFIVEGDSAGGSAKQGRDRQHQAILPLRGKPLNVEKKNAKEVLENEEMLSLISALGTNIGSEFDIRKLNYHKVIILSDADQDGAHIRAILLTFFFRYMRQLLQEGHVYIGMPPLYKVYKKDVIEYAYDDNELQQKIDKVGKGYSLQRYKGLGEMNPEQLWDTTMNPETRMLMQVTLEDAAEADRMITTLMGDAIESRKKYIQEYADFNKVDSFKEKLGV